MTGRSFLAILLPLALGAPLVQAETYKWVDETGVTTYSNKPPPPDSSGARSVELVQDRISVYQSDPTLKSAAAHYGYRQPNYAAEAEWLQRQQIMAMQWLVYADRYSGSSAGYPSYAYGGGIPTLGASALHSGFFGAPFEPLLNPPSPAALLQPRIAPALLLQARRAPLLQFSVPPAPHVHARPITRRAR